MTEFLRASVSRAAELRRSERTRFSVRTRRRSRRVLDVCAADLQEEMAGQRFSVPPDPMKTAATQRTSQRAERAINRADARAEGSKTWAGITRRSPGGN